jgi:tetratricopeptide (TPR) repeat protein
MDWGLAKVVGGAEQAAPSVENGGTDPSDLPGRSDSSAPGAADPAPVMTLEGQILGTPAYMAPEQARGEISAIDARTDIHALGAILYALLVLHPPFVGRTPWEILENVLRGEVTPPATHNRTGGQTGEVPAEPRSRLKPVHQPMLPPLVYRLQAAARTAGLFHPARGSARASGGSAARPFPHCPGGRVPEALSHVAMKALAAAPADRYQSVTELQAEIEAWRGGFATAAEEAGLWRQLALLVRRHRVVAMASLAAVLCLAVGFGLALVEWGAARASEERARLSEQEARDKEERAVAADRQRRETALAAAARFVREALTAAETGAMDEAERRIHDAEAISPDGPWAPFARGRLAAMRGDFIAAAEQFQAALKADAAHAESTAGLAAAIAGRERVEQALALAAKANEVTDWRVLADAGKTLYEARRLRECQVPLDRALELAPDGQDDAATANDGTPAMAELRDILDDARARVACEGFWEEIRDLPPKEQAEKAAAKLSEINGVPCRVAFAEVLNGAWEGSSAHVIAPADGKLIRFLYPLQGLPLTYLNIAGTSVRHLDPLHGMPLRRLGCGCGPKFTTLNPLKGMPLQYLDFYDARVRDLSPLRGMPLDVLVCSNNPDIRDLSPLRGLPLRSLNIACTRVRDLTPLHGMSLEFLDCRGIPEFTDLTPLADLPLKELSFGFTDIRDLSPLRGMPLETLDCTGCQHLADLTPLAGMALRSLSVHATPVQDLSPLRGMPLERLRCQATAVSDLSPLEGAPLTELAIAETKVTDLSPLAGMALERIALTPGTIVKGLEIVREMASLKQITVAPDMTDWLPAEEFWQRYDAGEFR